MTPGIDALVLWMKGKTVCLRVKTRDKGHAYSKSGDQRHRTTGRKTHQRVLCEKTLSLPGKMDKLGKTTGHPVCLWTVPWKRPRHLFLFFMVWPVVHTYHTLHRFLHQSPDRKCAARTHSCAKDYWIKPGCCLKPAACDLITQDGPI